MRILMFCLPCLASAVLSVSCGINENSAPPRRADRVLYQWHDDGGEGKVSVKISLADQIAEYRRGNRKIGWSYVATGKEGHGTSPGSYKVMEKIEDKHSNRYGWMEDEFGNVVNKDAKPTDKVPQGLTYVAAPMPYWMRLTSYGVGMHGGLIPEPGKPASHGCIRLPKDFVPVLFSVVDVGTPVTITNERSTISPDMFSPTMPTPPVEGERRVVSQPAASQPAFPSVPTPITVQSNSRRFSPY